MIARRLGSKIDGSRTYPIGVGKFLKVLCVLSALPQLSSALRSTGKSGKHTPISGIIAANIMTGYISF